MTNENRLFSRELYVNEQAMELVSRKSGSHHIVTISCVEGDFKPEITRQSLDIIQARHPHLNYRIVGDLNSLRFQSDSSKIPLRVLDLQSIEQWQEVVLEELNQVIDSDKVLMRAVLINFHSSNIKYFLTTLHHSIADGISVIQLHYEIFTYYQKIATSTLEHNISTLLAAKPIQEMMPRSMRGKFTKLKSVLYLLQWILKLYWHRPKTLSHEELAPILSRRSGFVHKRLSQELTKQLLDSCRIEKTTVQGALSAAMLCAVAKKIRNRDEEKLVLLCSSPVDGRKYLLIEANYENLSPLAQVTASFHTHDINTNFWDLAREVKKELTIGLQGDGIFHSILMSKIFFQALLSRPHTTPATIGISNVGRIEIPTDYSVFTLKEINFALSQKVLGGVFFVSVTTFEGTMFLNFTFAEPTLSQQTIEVLVKDTIDNLVNICNQSHSL